MAKFQNYPQKPFTPSANFLTRDPSGTGQVQRVKGQSILDAAVAEINSQGDIVHKADTLTELLAADYESGVYVVVGGSSTLFDSGRAIYRVSDPGSGGKVMANGNEAVKLILTPTFDTFSDALAFDMPVGQTCIVKGQTSATDGLGAQYEVKASGSGGATMNNGNELVILDGETLKPTDVSKIAGLVGTKDNQQISLLGWHPDSDFGGGEFYWDSARLKSDHNGGTVLSPTVPFTTTTADYLNGVGETDPAGTGCWVRVDAKNININQFGARETGDSTASIQASWNYVNSLGGGLVFADEGTYNYTRLVPVSHVIMRGSGSGRTFLNCTDSTTLDDNVSFGSSIRKLDDDTRVTRFALQDLGILASSQLTFQNIIALNLCACERGDWRNLFIANFGYSAITLARAEGGAEGLGFLNTAGEDGNYHTFTQISTANSGEYNPDGAVFWLLYKANSNKFYGIFGKGGIDDLIVIKNGNDNGFFGGTSESSRSVATIDGPLVRSNQFYNFRAEQLTGNAYNLLNGAADNLVMSGRTTGISGDNFFIDGATQNLNRIIGLEENNLRSQSFPPSTDYTTDHNKAAFKATSINGDVDYPLYIKSETTNDPTKYPVMVIFNDVTSQTAGNILGRMSFYNRDASGGAEGESAAIEGRVENTVGGSALVFSTGTGTTLTARCRIDRMGNILPESDNAYTLGNSSLEWSEVHSESYNTNGLAGATGSFTTTDGKTVTVTNGIITAIV